ncbi:hypothetical protein LINPERPRIM_LOCUS16404 [Linum perenne]
MMGRSNLRSGQLTIISKMTLDGELSTLGCRFLPSSAHLDICLCTLSIHGLKWTFREMQYKCSIQSQIVKFSASEGGALATYI